MTVTADTYVLLNTRNVVVNHPAVDADQALLDAGGDCGGCLRWFQPARISQ